MDKDNLCESLVKWLQTFPVPVKFHSIDDLADGVVMAHVLHQIAPDYFDSGWLTKIKTDARNNWRLKVSNLKKILKGILDYYAEVLGQQINDFHMPDLNSIGEKMEQGEECNVAELGRLLQLILGCAVNCEQKQEYIERIMSMEETVQQSVMHAIQELMTKEAPAHLGESFSELGDQLKRTTEELHTVIQERDEIVNRCRELDTQVGNLQEERVSFVAENQKLQERMNQAESLEDHTSVAGRRYQGLQHQVEKLQDEVYRLEAARDEYRVKDELQERQLLELQQKNDDMSQLAEEARSLKDEIDILKHNSDKVQKYESAIESYKKKMEEMSDLKRQLKMLEDKNTTYMQQNMELEEEVRRSSSLKSQLEMYKRQVQELQGKTSGETKRADKADFENRRLQEKITSLQKEKERLMIERDGLKETNEELTCSQLSGAGNNLTDVSSEVLATTPNFEMMSLPPEIREKLVRLQHENQMLKLSKNSPEDEDIQLVKSMLDDYKSRNSELESENRIGNQRIIELEAQIQDIQEQSTNASDHSEFIKKMNEQLQKNKKLEQEFQKQRTIIEEIESREMKTKESVSTLEELLTRKDDEMKAMEERYKKYLEKAKSVIKTLDPKLNAGPMPEIQALKNQIQEKDRLIEHLEKDHERAKGTRDQEEKLMVSAFYNLGMQLHRKAAEERLNSSGAGQSFLARQRQAQNRRLQTPPHTTLPR